MRTARCTECAITNLYLNAIAVYVAPIVKTIHHGQCDRPLHVHANGIAYRMRKCLYIPQNSCRICRHVIAVTVHCLHVTMRHTEYAIVRIRIPKENAVYDTRALVTQFNDTYQP